MLRLPFQIIGDIARHGLELNASCPRCVWEIDQAQLGKPPWSGSGQAPLLPGL
jgi:hypothetical protein